MKASVWKNTASQVKGRSYAIRVGIRNRKAYFQDESWDWVKIEIDGVTRRFKITGGFWRDCPEIRDDESRTIRDWVKQHHSLTWEPGHPPHVRLIPLGGRRFRLVP